MMFQLCGVNVLVSLFRNCLKLFCVLLGIFLKFIVMFWNWLVLRNVMICVMCLWCRLGLVSIFVSFGLFYWLFIVFCSSGRIGVDGFLWWIRLSVLVLMLVLSVMFGLLMFIQLGMIQFSVGRVCLSDGQLLLFQFMQKLIVSVWLVGLFSEGGGVWSVLWVWVL